MKMMPDFSHLPDVVWVKILSFLELEDCARMSQTCQRLNSAFNHPFLWHTVSLECKGCTDTKAEIIHMPNKCFHMIQRFGKYFKALNLTYFNYLHKNSSYTDTRHEMLTTLGKKCSLEKLTLYVSLIFRKVALRNIADLDGVISLIQNSSKLKSLDIVGWPMNPNIAVPNILQIIQSKLSLETLCLFWNGARSSSWESMNTLMPAAEDTLGTLTLLTNLTTLKLRSSMMNTELISELASLNRVPLKVLDVLITYSKQHNSTHIPDISASSWAGLVKRSPGLVVNFSVLNRVPAEELFIFLKPGIPVTCIQFLKYSHCKEAVIYHILETYCLSLEKFADFSFPGEAMDSVIVKLTSSCPKLNQFTFNGKLHCDTAAYVAKLKGTQWHVFQVNSENIITIASQEGTDNDILIRKNRDGSADIVRAPELLQSDIERQGLLEVMVHEVSEVIGKRWIPMDMRDRPSH